MRILLDEDDFEQLVSGEILERDGVQIALEDMGYDRMLVVIERLQLKLFMGDESNKKTPDS